MSEYELLQQEGRNNMRDNAELLYLACQNFVDVYEKDGADVACLSTLGPSKYSSVFDELQSAIKRML